MEEQIIVVNKVSQIITRRYSVGTGVVSCSDAFSNAGSGSFCCSLVSGKRGRRAVNCCPALARVSFCGT